MEHTHNTFISQAFSFAEKRLLALDSPEAAAQPHIQELKEDLHDDVDGITRADFLDEVKKRVEDLPLRQRTLIADKMGDFYDAARTRIDDFNAAKVDHEDNVSKAKDKAGNKADYTSAIDAYKDMINDELSSDHSFDQAKRLNIIAKWMDEFNDAVEDEIPAVGADPMAATDLIDFSPSADRAFREDINGLKDDAIAIIEKRDEKLAKAKTLADKLEVRREFAEDIADAITELRDRAEVTAVDGKTFKNTAYAAEALTEVEKAFFKKLSLEDKEPGKELGALLDKLDGADKSKVEAVSRAAKSRDTGKILDAFKEASDHYSSVDSGDQSDYKKAVAAALEDAGFKIKTIDVEDGKLAAYYKKGSELVTVALNASIDVDSSAKDTVDGKGRSSSRRKPRSSVDTDDEDLEKVDAEDVAEDFSDGVEDAIKDAKAESKKSEKGEIITKGISSAFRELHKAYKGAENKDEVNEEVEKIVEELLKKGEIDKLDVDLKEGTISASGKVDGVEWEVEEEISGGEEGSEGNDKPDPSVSEKYPGLSEEEAAFINALPEGMRGFGLLLIKVLKFAEGREGGNDKPDPQIKPDDVDSPEGIDSEIDELIKESEALTEKLKALKGKLGTSPALQSQINALEQQIAELQAKIDAKKQNKIIIVKSMNDFNDVFGPSGIKVIAIRRGGAPVFEFPTSCSPGTCDLVKGFCNEHKCDSGWVRTGPNSYSRKRMYVKQCRHLFAGCSKDYFQGLHRECYGKPAVNVSFNDNRVYNDNSTDRRNYGTINQIDNSRTAISGKDGGDIDLSGRNVNHVAQNRNDNRVDGRTLVEGDGNATNAGLSGATRRFAGVNKPPVTSNPGKMPKPNNDKPNPSPSNDKPDPTPSNDKPDPSPTPSNDKPDPKPDGSPSK